MPLSSRTYEMTPAIKFWQTLTEQLQAQKVELAVGNDLLRIGVFFRDRVFYVSSDTTWDPEELIELGNCLVRSVY